MAEIEQGIKYTIEAEDKASEKLKAAGKAGTEAFRPMEPIVSAMQGNFEGAAAGLLKMVASMKQFGLTVAQFTGLLFVLGGIVKAVKAWLDYFRDMKKAAADLRFDTAKTSLDGLKKSHEEYNRILAASGEKASAMKTIFEDEANAIREMTKAQLEFNKAQELAKAKTDRERDRIERAYAGRIANADRSADADIRANALAAADEEIARLEASLAEAEDYRSSMRKDARRYDRLSRKAYRENTGSAWRVWWKGSDEWHEDDENAQRMGALAATARANEQDAIREIEKIRTELDRARSRRLVIEAKGEAAGTANAAEDVNAHTSLVRKIEEEAAQDAAAEAKAAERVVETRKRGEDEVLAKRLENVKTAQEAEQAAASRLAAARAAVQQAWGWYRDKDSMKRQLDEEKANAAAERRFEKDFERLTFRRDWRTAKNLSVEQEAVRRVGIAREEEAAAKKAAAETAKNTARAAEELARIREAVTEE